MTYKNLDVILLVGGKSSRFKINSKSNNNFPKSFQKIRNKYLIVHCMETFIDFNILNFIFPIGNFKKIFINNFMNIKKIKNLKCNIFFNAKDYLKSKNNTNNIKEINILLLNTNINAKKSSRILKVIKSLNIENMFISYGDGIGNINFDKLYKSHKNSSQIMTVTAKKPKSQYGHFYFKNNKVTDFIEKPILNNWTNIGYILISKKAVKYIVKFEENDLEMGAIKEIAKKGKLNIFKHKGFWKSVDTYKDAMDLSNLLENNINDKK